MDEDPFVMSLLQLGGSQVSEGMFKSSMTILIKFKVISIGKLESIRCLMTINPLAVELVGYVCLSS